MADEALKRAVLEAIAKKHKPRPERKLGGNADPGLESRAIGPGVTRDPVTTTPYDRGSTPDVTDRSLAIRKFLQDRVAQAAQDNGALMPGKWPVRPDVVAQGRQGDEQINPYRGVPTLNTGGGSTIEKMAAQMTMKAGPSPQDMPHAQPDEPTDVQTPMPVPDRASIPDMEHAPPDSPETRGDGSTPQQEQDTGWVPPKFQSEPVGKDPSALASYQPQASYQPTPPAPVRPQGPAPTLPQLLQKNMPGMLTGSDVPPDLQPDQPKPQSADVPKADPRNTAPVQAEAQTPPPPPMPAPQNDLGPPPNDNTPFYSALQGVTNNAWAGLGQKAPEGGYYAGKIAEEQGKQKEYSDEKAARAKSRDEQVKEMLKQKFEGGQNELDRGIKTRGVAEQERRDAATEAANAIKDKENEADRAGKNEDRDLARKQQLDIAKMAQAGSDRRTNIIVNAGQEKQANKDVVEYNKERPDESTVGAYNRVAGRLSDARPIEGFDAGKGWDQAAKIPVVGGLFASAGDSARRGTEMEGLNQDVIKVMQGINHDAFGARLTDAEINSTNKRLGLAAGQGEAAFRRAALNEIAAVQEKAARAQAAQSPLAQQKIQERGLAPNLTPNPATGYAPHQGVGAAGQFIQKTMGVQPQPPTPTTPGVSPDLAQWITKKYGAMPQDASDPSRRNIYAAQAMQDPAFRELIRKQNHID